MIRKQELHSIVSDKARRKALEERRYELMNVYSTEAGKKHLVNIVATSGLLDRHVNATERDEGAHDFVVSMLEDMGLLDQDKLERALEYLLSMPAVLEEPKQEGEEE